MRSSSAGRLDTKPDCIDGWSVTVPSLVAGPLSSWKYQDPGAHYLCLPCHYVSFTLLIASYSKLGHSHEARQRQAVGEVGKW